MQELIKHLRRYPFLRFLFPLIVGIALADWAAERAEVMAWAAMGMVCIIGILLVFLTTRKIAYHHRALFGVGLTFFFLALGTGLGSRLLTDTRYDWPTDSTVYKIELTGDAQKKERTMLFPATVRSVYEAGKELHVGKEILVYIMTDSLAGDLKSGDVLLARSQINAPTNRGNPEEFDYARFLIHRGISGTMLLFSGNWELTEHQPRFNLKQTALRMRAKLLEYYQDWGFNGDELGVLSALTLGYKEELSEEVKSAYSTAGISHILALSGLHIGILFLVLDYLLHFMGNKPFCRLLRSFLVIVVLWAFAFISGLSPSVVRSVLMFTLVALAKLMDGKPITLNTLAATAMCMLLYRPFYLFDVGFQLSYTAVASIVVIQPWLNRLLNVRNRWLKPVWGLITVSTAAQIGTAPIAAYYFGTFPLLFLVTNLVAIPAVSIILYLSVAAWSLLPLPLLQKGVLVLLQSVLVCLNKFVSFVEQLPYTSLQGLNPDLPTLFGYFAILLLLTTRPYLKKQTIAKGVLVCILIPSIYHTATYFGKERHPSIMFYNASSAPAIHCLLPGRCSYLALPYGEASMERLTYATRRFWQKEHIDTPLLLHEGYEDKQVWYHQGVVCFGNKRIGMLYDTRWDGTFPDVPLSVDYIYICKGYTGDLTQVQRLFTVQYIILDASLTAHRASAWEKQCHTAGIPSHNLSRGALRIPI